MGKRAYKSWDEVYLAHLARGDDHGYAYYAADMWQKRRTATAKEEDDASR